MQGSYPENNAHVLLHAWVAADHIVQKYHVLLGDLPGNQILKQASVPSTQPRIASNHP
jgi:hypothetical protein